MLEIVIFIYIWLFSIAVIALGKHLKISLPKTEIRYEEIFMDLSKIQGGRQISKVIYDNKEKCYYTFVKMNNKKKSKPVYVEAETIEGLREKINMVQ